MKLLSTVLLLLTSSIIYSQSENFTLVRSNSTTSIEQYGTSQNKHLTLIKKAKEGKKFVLISGTIKEGYESEVDSKSIFFKSGEQKISPVGQFESRSGKVSWRVSDLSTSWSDDFGYVFLVDQAINSGTLLLGETTIQVKKIDENWPESAKPRSIVVKKSELIKSFKAIDELEDKADVEYEIDIEYKAASDQFVIVTIEALGPASLNGEKEKGSNYTFHPMQFSLRDQNNAVTYCVAFIREGYENGFSESMNHGILYGAEEPKTIQLIFPIGSSTEFELLQNGKVFDRFKTK